MFIDPCIGGYGKQVEEYLGKTPYVSEVVCAVTMFLYIVTLCECAHMCEGL